LKLHRRISKTAVVFVTYGNRHHYFSKLIERLFSMGVEFIIAVDNNSHSESKETLLKYSSGKKLKLCIIENSQNLGSAYGFSQGIKAAIELGAEFIWLLDDDLLPDMDSLLSLLEVWNKLSLTVKTHQLMLLSNRVDRQNIYIRAILSNNPELVIGDKNKFRSFHILKLIHTLSSKFFVNKEESAFSKKTNMKEFPEYAPIGAACYGGMFFNVSLVDTIGFPDKNYILYYDDYEFSLRHIRQGGEIYFVTKSILRDQVKSWNNSRWKFAFLEIATNRNLSILYCSVRNSVYFEKKYNVDNIFIYYLNLVIYTFFTCLAALIFCRFSNIKVYLQALFDGLNGKLGFNPKYLLK
jgi:GT2 family glycosyltransferase